MLTLMRVFLAIGVTLVVVGLYVPAAQPAGMAFMVGAIAPAVASLRPVAPKKAERGRDWYAEG